MRPLTRVCRVLFAALLLGAVYADSAFAEENRVAVRVSSSSGGSVYLDKGRASGIQPGDTVLLQPIGNAIVKMTVQSVSRSNARCILPVPATPIPPGTQGVVLTREAAEPGLLSRVPRVDEVPQREVPDHPAWSEPLDDWSQDMPLLASAEPIDSSERDPDLHGRVFADFTHNWDYKYTDNQYSLGRVGTNLRIDNALRQGGTFYLDAQVNGRYSFFADDADDIVYTGNPARLSYSLGGKEDQLFRFEIGRFLQYEFPEFGYLDGAEFEYSVTDNTVIGVSFGAMPEPFPEFNSGDDLQAAVYYRIVFGDNADLTTRVGYQKTWHRGHADRDLMVVAVDYFPTPHFSFNGSLWGDFYGPKDQLKSGPFEITQAILQGTYQIDPGHGIGVHVSDIRWPDILRNEFQPIFASQVLTGRVTRYNIYTWQQIRDDVRVNANVGHWKDETSDGTTWDVALSLRDLLYDKGEVSFGVYGTDGLYNSGPGGRVSLSRFFSRGFVVVSYDVSHLDFLGGTEESLLHGVHASADLSISPTVNFTVTGDTRFGETQGAMGIGAYLQKRF